MMSICPSPTALPAAPQVGSDGDALNGWVSDAQLAAQIAALNVAFVPFSISFVAAGVNRIKGHREWWCAVRRVMQIRDMFDITTWPSRPYL